MNQLLYGENIVKSFDSDNENRNVLDGISFSIAPGEFVSIMGPSGSGKSTFLFAVSGMEKINKGKVVFNQHTLSDLSDNQLSDLRRTKMGFVFQQPTLLKNLNLLDNILLPSLRDNPRQTEALTKKAMGLMKQIGIENLAQRNISKVSGGQLQRAGICRALMCDPSIIFCDEPTGALNSKSAGEVMDLLSEIHARGTALLLVTHDAAVAARTQRVLFLKDGKMIQELDFKEEKVITTEEKTEMVIREMHRMGI